MATSFDFNRGPTIPGSQCPTGQNVMDDVFFVKDSEWEHLRESKNFDYIVVGSGICGYSFVERVIKNNPTAKILIIERGGFFLLSHFRNLPAFYTNTLVRHAETYPWKITPNTSNGTYVKRVMGMAPFFGGRSLMWSGWCPKPTIEELEGWPRPVIRTIQKYCNEAEKLLNVTPANEIQSSKYVTFHKPVYGNLQARLYQMLTENQEKLSSVTRINHAPLAMAQSLESEYSFQRFSVPNPFLTLGEIMKYLTNSRPSNSDVQAMQKEISPFKIVAECVVRLILQNEEKQAVALETSRGRIEVGNAKIILAMGTIPAATLVLNSFPSVKNVGTKLTAHFISSITARVPKVDYKFVLNDLELAAIYLAGKDKQGKQFHIQLSAIRDANPILSTQSALRHMPAANLEKLISSLDHVVFVCGVLGEMDDDNDKNWVRKNDDNDITSNVTLQLQLNENDESVWNSMEEETFEMLERILSQNGKAGLEYWHTDLNGIGAWNAQRPPTVQIRAAGVVHEASTLWIGEDSEAPVDLNYKLNGVGNVYVTGGALWPKSGSFGPTLTMAGLCQHLADTLEPNDSCNSPLVI